jgi:AraC-like DNA-binding protein
MESDDFTAGTSRAPRVVMDLGSASGIDVFKTWATQVDYLATCTLIDPGDAEQFSVKVDLCIFEGMHISTTRLSHAQRQVRTLDLVRKKPLTDILFHFHVDYAMTGQCHKRKVDAGTGDLVILDFRQPYDVTMSAGTVIGLLVPLAALPASMRDRDLQGLKADPGNGAARFLSRSLQTFAELAATMTVAEGLAAIHALLGLTEAAFPPADTLGDDPGTQQANAPVMEKAQSYIEAHIGDADFTLDRLACELRLSRSSLYRLFEPLGGVANYIRERRLLRSYEIISNDLSPHESLSTIAFDQGFKSEAQFSRAFKAMFAVSPSDLRRKAKALRREGKPSDPPPKTPGIAPVGLSHQKKR